MGARQRLNSLYLIGVLMAAAVIGGALQSWSVFIVSAAILTATLVYGGDIRPTPQSSRRTRNTRRRR